MLRLSKIRLIFATLLVVSIAVLISKTFISTTSASSGQTTENSERLSLIERQVGKVPEEATPDKFLSRLEPAEKLNMVISFEVRDQVGLQQLLSDLYNPASSSYHKWLTPEEFGLRFGRSEDEFNRAINWLASQGFTVDQAWPNRLSITFTGTTEVVEKAFRLQMGRFQDNIGNRTFYANQQRPTLPAELSSITISLLGLNDAHLKHHGNLNKAKRLSLETVREQLQGQAQGSAITPDFNINGTRVLGPNDLAVAYGYQSFLTANIKGQNQKVGIIIESDVLDSDIAEHRSILGLPAANLQRKIPPGLTNPGTKFEGEAELDVSSVGEVAPLAEIDLVLVPQLDSVSITTAENFAVNTLKLPVVNESFGGCEQFNFDSSEATLFQQARAQGTAFFISSGDEGAECAGGTPGQRAVELPAAYADVTAVGGTTLSGNFDVNSNLTSVASEVVWNTPPGVRFDCNGNENTGGGAGGGGQSTFVAKPSYQVSATGVTGGVPLGNGRFLPDISLAADPNSLGVPFFINFASNGLFFIGGGTSQSSPLMAGMWTLVNQFAGSNQGSPNTQIYQQGVKQYSQAGPVVYRDIKSGNNSTGPRVPCTQGATGFQAVVGYDASSGWGAPLIAAFANQLSVVKITFKPDTGHEGDTVVITGSSFIGATDVKFNGASAGAPGSGFTVDSDTQITAFVPAAATTGKISVVTPNGTISSATNFTVTPALDSFSPTFGPVGTMVTLNGSGFVNGTTMVKFNGVLTSATFMSSTLIKAVVPSTATSGLITVTTGAGTCTGPGNFNVTPKVVSFTPMSGAVGTNVTISGMTFNGATQVTFGNGSMNIAPPSLSTSITVAVPANATTGPISVTTPAGSSSSTSSFAVLPKITSFQPPAGPEGTPVTITGTTFSNLVSVKFGTVTDTTAHADPNNPNTVILATVPVGATSNRISVTTSNGLNNALVTAMTLTNFNVTPTIAASNPFNPPNGPAGTIVTITGTSFAIGAMVKFSGALPVAATLVNTTTIKATVPATAISGAVIVTTPSGSSGPSQTIFQVNPGVTTFIPMMGPAGTIVTITGTGFSNVTDVRFSGVSATSIIPVPNSTTSIKAVAPIGGTTGHITVTADGTSPASTPTYTFTPGIGGFNPASGQTGTTITITGSGLAAAVGAKIGTVSLLSFGHDPNNPDNIIFGDLPNTAITGRIAVTVGATTFMSVNNFNVTPTITSLDTTSGAAGAVVTITGSGFAGVTSVKFGGANGGLATPMSVTPTTIKAAVPTTAFSGPIVVTTATGTASSQSFSVLPKITSFSPTMATEGTALTIMGSGLSNVLSVTFGSANQIIITSSTPTSITLPVPLNATFGQLQVHTVEGNATSTGNFSVLPKVTNLSPASGPEGKQVTITGSGLKNLAAVGAVKFGAITATNITPDVNNPDTTITVTVPPGATTNRVTVTTTNGTLNTSAMSASNFTVTPTITSLSALQGVAGDIVTITGTTFVGLTSVKFGGSNGAAGSITSLSPTTLKVIVPMAAFSGPIVVTTFSGSASSASFSVMPKIVSISPLIGTHGVTTVTIFGSGFTNLQSVNFGSTATTTFVSHTATAITLIVPANAPPGKVSITVNTSEGSFTDTNTAQQFTVN